MKVKCKCGAEIEFDESKLCYPAIDSRAIIKLFLETHKCISDTPIIPIVPYVPPYQPNYPTYGIPEVTCSTGAGEGGRNELRS